MARTHAKSALKTVLVAMLLSITIVSARASTEKVLWNFVSDPKGANPSSLIADAGGNLYGTTTNGGLHSEGTVFKLVPRSGGGWTETVLYSFSKGAGGYAPLGGVIMDAGGNLYGTASTGGSEEKDCQALGGCGTVFELTPGTDDTWSYKVLHTFQFLNGMYPSTPLVLDASGNLFGTTPDGGSCSRGGYGCGTVFEVAPVAGGRWKETVLYSFPCVTGCSETGVPSSGLILDATGNLYGTTYSDGESPGAVFELSPVSNGNWKESVLYYFCSRAHCADGDFPRGGLIFDRSGSLYGTTANGGTQEGEGDGVVFKLTQGAHGSWEETVLFTFHGGNEGFAPFSGVVFGAEGNLYGTTIWGGKGGAVCRNNDGFGCGIVFELTPSSTGWTESILHDFTGARDGIGPNGLILDNSGNLYGTTASSGEPPDFNGGGTVFKLSLSSDGWRETKQNFLTSDGMAPDGGLISDGAGNLYGATASGGTHESGSVFELSPVADGAWRRRILHSFAGEVDGEQPSAPLLLDDAGNIYGTTFEGGSADVGVVFELSPASGGTWSEKILHVFQGPDGSYPVGGLAFDAVGNLYGTTEEGGAACCGTVFELSPAADGTWTHMILHNFVGGADDGQVPLAGVILDSAGNIYGTTATGGFAGGGFGVVFEMSPGSGGTWTEHILHRFTGSDGWSPQAGVILDQAGDLYGTTYWGGSSGCGNGCGVVFKLSPATGNRWKETIIRKLDPILANPQSSLVFDVGGSLYGVASNRDSECPSSCGAIFELVPTEGEGWWKAITLYSFTGGRDGSYPAGPLLLDTAGNLYGGAFYGGPAGDGIIFEITP
jgi:uncharacterized repeat protein (TIGR03803 family)